jgi:hypothetical protein
MASVSTTPNLQPAPFIMGQAMSNSATVLQATVASGNTITFTNIFPTRGDLPVTPVGFTLHASTNPDTNGSPGTLTVGDGETANVYMPATSMGRHNWVGVGSGTTTNTNGNLVVTLGTVGTAASNVTWRVVVHYICGDANHAG